MVQNLCSLFLAIPADGAGKEKQKESSSSSVRANFSPWEDYSYGCAAPTRLKSGDGTSSNEIIGIYETPRDLYRKIRLAPNMIKEHYMPSYISTMESLLEQLQKDDSACTTSNGLWTIVELSYD